MTSDRQQRVLAAAAGGPPGTSTGRPSRAARRMAVVGAALALLAASSLVPARTALGTSAGADPASRSFGFEDGSTRGWVHWGSRSRPVLSTVTDPVRSGRRALRVRFRVGTGAGSHTGACFTMPDVAGRSYTLRAWVRSTSSRLTFRLPGHGNAPTASTRGPNWQQLSWTFTAPSSRGYGCVVTEDRTAARQTAYVDDVSFTPADAPPDVPPRPPASGHAAKTLSIWLENEGQSGTYHAGTMPYLDRLADTYGRTTDYHGLIHPSLGNYMGFAYGDDFGIRDDRDPPAHTVTALSVFDVAVLRGHPARTYSGSMSSTCQQTDAGRDPRSYQVHHNPWAYGRGHGSRARCVKGSVRLGAVAGGRLADDVTRGTLPDMGLVEPDNCDNGHSCSLGTADRFLRSWLPVIMAGRDYRSGRLSITVTFDEPNGGESIGKPIEFVAIHPSLHGTVVRGRYNHYALTRWYDDTIGAARQGKAADAGDLRAAFGL